MNLKKIVPILIFIAILLAIFVLPETASATVTIKSPIKYAEPGEAGTATVLGRVVNYISGISGAALLLLFVYGGYTWLMSAGSQQKVEKGKQILFYAVLGFILLLGGYIIIRLTITTLVPYTPPPPGTPAPSPSPSPVPSPPPTDTCGTGSYSGGSCVEKTATITGCDKLSPPQQAFSGGGCEGTANSAGKDPSNYLCCKPFPADTCPGTCVTAATDCLTLSTPMKESSGTNQCETSKYATPSKPKCCEVPTGICPWDPATPPFSGCVSDSSGCCDCNQPGSGTPEAGAPVAGA